MAKLAEGFKKGTGNTVALAKGRMAEKEVVPVGAFLKERGCKFQ